MLRLKKILAFAILLGLCILGVEFWKRGWPIAIVPLDAIAGVMALLLYEGKNVLRGPWDFVKITIVAFALGFGYLSLLFYIIIAQDKEATDRT